MAKKLTKKKQRSGIKTADLLSTGSTPLNLACSGRAKGGFLKGHYYLLVGSSMSGKTFLSLTCLAEAANNPAFDEYRLIHDDIEHGALMNRRKFFGSKAARRIETIHSESLEEMFYNVDDAQNEGTPFIYIVDSMDALEPEEDEEKFQEQKTAYRKGKKTKGTYGAGKAKQNSRHLRRIVSKLGRNGSILIIICQSRDNLSFGFEKESRSGGRALRFYATMEIWAKVKEKIQKTVKGKKRVIGVISRVQVKKNRIEGTEQTIMLPIYKSIGFDDVGACIDYLIDEGHWSGTEKKIKAPEFKFNGTREGLIRKIEEGEMYEDLQQLCQQTWKEIEEACSVKRISRYA